MVIWYDGTITQRQAHRLQGQDLQETHVCCWDGSGQSIISLIRCITGRIRWHNTRRARTLFSRKENVVTIESSRVMVVRLSPSSTRRYVSFVFDAHSCWVDVFNRPRQPRKLCCDWNAQYVNTRCSSPWSVANSESRITVFVCVHVSLLVASNSVAKRRPRVLLLLLYVWWHRVLVACSFRLVMSSCRFYVAFNIPKMITHVMIQCRDYWKLQLHSSHSTATVCSSDGKQCLCKLFDIKYSNFIFLSVISKFNVGIFYPPSSTSW